jgi:hypothetical protein
MADDDTRKTQPPAWDAGQSRHRHQPANQPRVAFRDVIDGIAIVEAFADPRPRGPQLEALPRPAPPQEAPRPWWRWRPWR